MNAITKITDDQSIVGKRKIDPFRGSSSGIVSRQWFARPNDQRFLNLTDLYKSVDARRERSKELTLASKALRVAAPDPQTIEDTHDLWIETASGERITPTHWAFSQLCSLAGAPAAYLRTKPSQLVADLLIDDYMFRRNVEDVKLYSADTQLLAATGPDYGRIFDADVVRAVMQIAGNGDGDTNWKVPGQIDWATRVYDPYAPITIESTSLYASDRDVFLFLVDDLHPIEVGKLADGSPDYMFRGFIVTNSEVGKSSLRIITFYLRGTCMNRTLWGCEGFQEMTIRHTRTAPSRFIEMARPALEAYAQGSSTKLIEGVNAAKAAKLADDQDAALAFLQARKFSRTKAAAILERGEAEEGRPVRTAWDFANAITADARDIQHTDQRFEQEMVAKAILDKVA